MLSYHRILLRLFLGVNLMTLLYQEDTETQGLCAKLDHPQTQAVLNGVKHSFIGSFSRIAFADEPEWIQALHTRHTERRMESMAEMASSLLELVLSPDELDEVWQMLAGEEEEDQDMAAGAAAFGDADDPMIID